MLDSASTADVLAACRVDVQASGGVGELAACLATHGIARFDGLPDEPAHRAGDGPRPAGHRLLARHDPERGRLRTAGGFWAAHGFVVVQPTHLDSLGLAPTVRASGASAPTT